MDSICCVCMCVVLYKCMYNCAPFRDEHGAVEDSADIKLEPQEIRVSSHMHFMCCECVCVCVCVCVHTRVCFLLYVLLCTYCVFTLELYVLVIMYIHSNLCPLCIVYHK